MKEFPLQAPVKDFLELSQCPQLLLNHKSGNCTGNVLLPLSLTLGLPDHGTGQCLLSSWALTVSGQLEHCSEHWGALATQPLVFIVPQALKPHQTQMNPVLVLCLLLKGCNLSQRGQLLQIFTFSSVLMYLLNLLNASILNFISSPRRSK